ncbi:MAG: hypothetical protein ACR2JU_05570 [Nocardioidaceae bacterium]
MVQTDRQTDRHADAEARSVGGVPHPALRDLVAGYHGYRSTRGRRVCTTGCSWRRRPSTTRVADTASSWT